MATVDPIFAVLSAAVYEKGRNEENLIRNLPDGVTLVTEPTLAHFRDDSTGFEAGAYFYGGLVVIAYAGTLPGPRDFITDAALGLGIADEQMLQAAEFKSQRCRTRERGILGLATIKANARARGVTAMN